MLLKNQSSSIISTYAADVSGVCSALFEYGGMCIMHDASGCNSTYNTHDEPRWYNSNSLVFISALSETEAILGDDDKLINDIVDTAKDLKPHFIAIAGTPIPMIMGTDFNAIANIVESQTELPTFGFNTNGMHSYLYGASMAFEELANRMTDKNITKSKNLKVNIIGTTPLDFSVNNYIASLKNLLIENEIEIVSEFGINGSLDNVKNSGSASVNLVVSSCGIRCAKKLQNTFNTPYIFGLPIKGFEDEYIKMIKDAFDQNKSFEFCGDLNNFSDILIIGEAAFCFAISKHINKVYNVSPMCLCPPDTETELLKDGIEILNGELITSEIMTNKKVIIADPLFKPISPDTAKFISFPHEAFSGRIFREEIYNLLEEIKF